MNYFELFAIPVSLQPDEKTVKKKFYELSRMHHPDFYTNASESEQASALEQSSQINKAYKILLNNDEVIKYVLQQKSLLVDEEKYELPPAFLMEMLELSEQMMDAKMDENASALSTVQVAINNIQNEIYEPVKRIIEHYQEGITTEKELLQVKDYYYKKKYLNRILAGMN